MTKVCKQCGRSMPIEHYRKNVSKSKGVYQTETGHWTVCKDCEALNNKATRCWKNNTNPEFLARVEKMYKMLVAKGLEPKGGYAAHILNKKYAPRSGPTHVDALMDTLMAVHGLNGDAAEEHLQRLKDRSYESVDAADDAHRLLEGELRASGLYEECADLLDAWFME